MMRKPDHSGRLSQPEFKLSEYKALYYTSEFKDLLKQCPELMQSITRAVDVAQKWLADPEKNQDPFDENGSLTYGNTIRFDFVDAKLGDVFGDYSAKQVVYFEIHAADQHLFLKAAPAEYHSGGVTEALATDFLKEEINNKNIKGVEVVESIAAYQSGQNKYYVSRLKNIGELYALEYVIDPEHEDYPSELKSRYASIQDRIEKIKKILKKNNMLDSLLYHNMLYDLSNDRVVLFDVNPGVQKKSNL